MILRSSSIIIRTPSAFTSALALRPPFVSTFHKQQHWTNEQKHAAIPFTSSPNSFLRMSSSANDILSDLARYPAHFAIPIACSVTILLSVALFTYRSEIQKRLKQIRNESWIFGAGVTMERVPGTSASTSTTFDNLRLLELTPEFKYKYEKQGWKLQSLGDYMSSLRPVAMNRMKFSMDDLPTLFKREIEAGLATGLLRVLGPNLGRALLPAVGLGPIVKAQSLVANFATNWFLSPDGGISTSQDKGGVPISLMTLLAASDLNARLNSGGTNDDDHSSQVGENIIGFKNMDLTSIEKMKVGEVCKGPTFAGSAKANPNEDLYIPDDSPFVLSEDFDDAIHRMEEILGYHNVGEDKKSVVNGNEEIGLEMAKMEVMDDAKIESDLKNSRDKSVRTIQDPESKMIHDKQGMLLYDPEDRSMGEPVPVNPRLFPDLHLGWGDAKCSHTKREVLKMRLLSVLLNRLGSNYYRRVYEKENDNNIFSIQMTPDSKPLTTPWELVEALIDSGHEIEMVPTSHLTTFGVCLCVKEVDDKWTNIPLAVFLESGYEDKHGRIAPAMMPHSGLDLFIKGPLAGARADGTPSQLRLQHFEGIEGFCGWHSNEHAEVPFNQDVESCERLAGADVVRGVRIAALYAVILNGLATKLQLPFGGYGLTAVCNDSAALVQECLYGKSTIYPMTSVGRFMHSAMRYGQSFQEELCRSPSDMKEEIGDLFTIIDAMKRIPNDLNASPSNAHSAARRLLQTLPQHKPFVLMRDAHTVMGSILEEHQEDTKVANEIKRKASVTEKP